MRRVSLDLRSLSWIVLGASALFRLVVLAREHAPVELWFGDAITYRDMVAGLLSGHLTSAAWIWTPGYAICALPFALLLGPAHGLVAASLFFGLAGPAAVLIVTRNTRWARRGAIAAILLAVLPEAVVASTRPLSDATGLGLYVLTILALEILRRRPGARAGLVAGLVAGLAVLTRAELLPGIAVLGCLLLLRRTRRALAAFSAFGVATAAVALPFVLALHSISGVWGITLKPHYTILVRETYRQHEQYVDQRLAWSRVEAMLQTDDGEWNPRAIAAAAEPGRYVRARLEHPASWLGNVATGIEDTRWPFLVFLGVGLIGLPFLRGQRPSQLVPALASLIPFLVVPLFFHARGRYLFPLVPGLLWGGAALIEATLDLARRRRLAAVVAPAALLASGLVLSWLGVRTALGPPSVVWRDEVTLMLRQGRSDEAVATVEAWMRRYPRDPIAWMARADVLEAGGNAGTARDAMSRAVELGIPGWIAAHWYLDRKMTTEAGDALDRTDGRGRDSPEYLDAARRLALARGDWPRAVEACERMLALGFDDDSLQFNLGLSYYRLGNADAARTHLLQAVASGDSTIRARSEELLRRLPGARAPGR